MEGMSLAPHHFQVQNRYFEDLIEFGACALHYNPVGFLGIEWNVDALRNGILSLSHARGFLPDGLAFVTPECDCLPGSRQVRDLISPMASSTTVHLAITELKVGAANCGEDNRYLPVDRTLADETNGADPRAITFGRKNFFLLLDGELKPGMSSLPIGRIIRDGAGHLIFDPEFIPPSLGVGGNARLLSIAGRLIELLEEKARSLAVDRTADSAGGLSQRDVASFWYLHCINSGLTELRHLVHAKQGHPEELYRAMLRLGGALCTFSLTSQPGDLPLYNHLNPEACFPQLERQIRSALEIMLPSTAIHIPLKAGALYLYNGEIIDSRCLGRARWILGVRAQTAESALITEAPRLIKFCSLAAIEKLVQRSLNGLDLVHLQVPPAEIKPKVEMQYFGISRNGPCWEHIQKTRKVGAYVPGQFPNPELELIVIMEA